MGNGCLTPIVREALTVGPRHPALCFTSLHTLSSFSIRLFQHTDCSSTVHSEIFIGSPLGNTVLLRQRRERTDTRGRVR